MLIQNQNDRAISHDTEDLARRFCEAIKTLCAEPENLENMELYLAHHFDNWMATWATCPEELVSEMEHFANMED